MIYHPKKRAYDLIRYHGTKEKEEELSVRCFVMIQVNGDVRSTLLEFGVSTNMAWRIGRGFVILDGEAGRGETLLLDDQEDPMAPPTFTPVWKILEEWGLKIPHPCLGEVTRLFRVLDREGRTHQWEVIQCMCPHKKRSGQRGCLWHVPVYDPVTGILCRFETWSHNIY